MCHKRSLLLLALGLLGLVAGSCSCNEPEGSRITPQAEEASRKLEPLPEAPHLEVAQEPVPGSAGDLAVVAVRPLGASPVDARPTITFSKPMVAVGGVQEEAKLAAPATIEPPIPGTWRWLGSASVELVPEKPIPFSTRYSVTIPAGIRALDGSALAEGRTWEFETPKPEVQRIEPASDFKWLGSSPTFSLTLNQPVANLAEAVRLELEGGRTVALKLVSEKRLDELRRERADRGTGERSGSAPAVEDRRIRYELAPVESLPLDRPVSLVVAGSLRGSEGPLTLGADATYAYRTHGGMRITGAESCFWKGDRCPYGPLVLSTSNLAKVDGLKERLSIEPAVEIEWDSVDARIPDTWERRESPVIIVPGGFRPGTTYVVRVKDGLEDAFGQKAGAFEARITLDDRQPSFDVGSTLALIEMAGDGTLPIESVNLERVDADLWRVTPSELAKLLRSHSLPKSPATRRETVDVRATKNRTKWTPLDVRKAFPPGAKTGLFAASFRAPGLSDSYPRRVFGQVTDFAVHAKLGPASGLVWVTRLSSSASVPNASLALYDKDGVKRWQGATDEEGIAKVPGLATLLEAQSSWEGRLALISAEKDGELGVTWSDWDDGLGPWAFGLPSDWEGKEPVSLGMVFPERGIYRPGDTVHLKGLVRFRKVGALGTPAKGSKLTLRVTNPRGDELLSREVTLSSFGTFATDMELGKDVPLGSFGVVAEGQIDGQTLSYGGSFRVEEYRAPQFRVDASVERKNALAGEPLKASVLSRYLFGGAMADAKVRWSLVRRPEFFAPPGNEGFDFGSQVWWWDDERPVPSTEVMGSGEARTASHGELAIDLGTPQTPGEKTYDYTLEAEVEDVNRQRVAARTAFTVHPASFYAGIRVAATGFAQAGRPLQTELIAVTPEGDRAPGVKVAFEARRREWKSIKKKGVGEQWFTVSEPVEEKVYGCEVVTRVEPKSCSFEPAEPGLYVLEAKLTDAQGRTQISRTSVYVVGSGWVSWQRNDTDRIDLVADRQVYEPGQTAKLLVKSPYPSVEALLTVEREGVFSSRKVLLDGSATTLEIPIDESMIPNAFVSVLLSRGRVSEGGIESGEDPGRPAVRIGYTQLKVEKRSKRLSVQVTPDATERRPREKVKVALEVKDFQGKGVPAELAVWAVDEGVLRLTGYQIPDPIEAIHPLRGLSVKLGEPLVHLVQRRLYGEKGQTAGGGGGDGTGAGFRSAFKTTVLFAPEVRTDGRGRANVEFELPDNLTTYRIMAMAITEGDRFGTGQAEVAVSKPLLALPALPRLARVGDRFEAGVVIHTGLADGGQVKVKAFAEGLSIEGPAEKTTVVAKGQPREVRFRFEAKQPGSAKLRFSVEGMGERDGVEQRLPIQLPVAMEAVATYGETRDERIEALDPPGGIRPGIGGLELTFASSVLGGFDENMRQLVDYPYGCLEQQASRLVPFVALRELSGRFGVPWAGPETYRSWIGDEALASRGSPDPDEVIRATVKSIEQLQNHDGGYRYWASSGCSTHFASTYAVLALARAKEVGFPVDAAALARGQAFVANEVAAGRCERCGWGCNKGDDPTRAFALYALARTGAPKPSYYGELFERRKELPLYAQAMLADALFVGKGDRRLATQLLGEILVQAKESAQELHFEETGPASRWSPWSSDTRTTALVLQTLTTISPDHPYVAKLATYLKRIRGRDGRYRNTQEAAFSLMALNEVSRTKEKEVPDFTGSVRLEGDELASVRFQGRSMQVEKAQVEMARLAAAGAKAGASAQPTTFERDGSSARKLAISKSGAGILYYGALLRYAPAEMPTTPLDRGFAVQRWIEPYDGGGQARELVAGELVRVHVRVATAQERSYAVISVPLPAGLEAVDTSLATTATLASASDRESSPGFDEGDIDGEDGDSWSPWAFRFFSPFNHSEQRDDRVMLFADRMPAGVHSTSFVARATTPGDFVLQPAHAEEMYGPETFGRSDGGRILVIDRSQVAGR
ncbi:Ig-like domain-containing alpha-2-macroglobulin family protein [Vulgatibacter incomptus]|uniref:Alpha-2-macroglobulin domain protein n=1 Tax=Vulgatibacter incomptus TaxID=1391653 RepID=A0A0K1PAA9_9BACT|nr:Ig-like domain-containing alpha-2-macroglobulin family protein [Vulgatibacter incomptus]AKU90473.1 alpha-2-macroglobulin domain protein [Vulgatibacter incomptus]